MIGSLICINIVDNFLLDIFNSLGPLELIISLSFLGIKIENLSSIEFFFEFFCSLDGLEGDSEGGLDACSLLRAIVAPPKELFSLIALLLKLASRLLRYIEVGNWLQSLLLAHDETDFLRLIISHYFGIPNSSLFPLLIRQSVKLCILFEQANFVFRALYYSYVFQTCCLDFLVLLWIGVVDIVSFFLLRLLGSVISFWSFCWFTLHFMFVQKISLLLFDKSKSGQLQQ